MEFSILELLGLIQRVDGFSRLLARVEMADFFTYGILLTILWFYLSSGAKNLINSFDKKFGEFSTKHGDEMKELKQEVKNYVNELKENDNKNAESIARVAENLTNLDKNIHNLVSDSENKLRMEFTSGHNTLQLQITNILTNNINNKKNK